MNQQYVIDITTFTRFLVRQMRGLRQLLDTSPEHSPIAAERAASALQASPGWNVTLDGTFVDLQDIRTVEALGQFIPHLVRANQKPDPDFCCRGSLPVIQAAVRLLDLRWSARSLHRLDAAVTELVASATPADSLNV